MLNNNSLIRLNVTRRMAIANGTCVSFCIAEIDTLFGYLTRVSRRYVFSYSRFSGAGIWLRQESLRHILAFHGYAPAGGQSR